MPKSPGKTTPAKRKKTASKLKKSTNPMSRVKRNVYISGRRTTVNIENYLWENLERIAMEEGMSVDEICTEISRNHRGRESLATVIRYVAHEVAQEKKTHLYRNSGDEMHDHPQAGFAGGDGGKSAFRQVLGRLGRLS